jgi:hypothetical protein
MKTILGRGRVALLGTAFALAIALSATAQEEPESDRGLVSRTDAALDGYTLFAPLRSTTIYLIDMDGEIAHEWKTAYAPGNSVYLLENGNLLRCAREQRNPVFHGGGQGGRIQELRWDGAVLWDYVVSDEQRMHHHDVEPLPNGNVLLLVWEAKTSAEVLAAGRDPEQISEDGLWPDAVLEIEPDRTEGGRVVWEWHAWDHLVQDQAPDLANFADPAKQPERIDINADHRHRGAPTAADDAAERERQEQMRQLGYVGDDEEEDEDDEPEGPDGGRDGRGGPRTDWLHTNSVSYDAEHDLIALSVREMSEIWIIDHSTTTEEAAGSRGGRYGRGGDLLARWGNPQNHGAGDAGDRRLFVQHDARWIPSEDDDALHVLVFNNGRGRGDGEYSTVEEIVLPFNEKTGFAAAPVEASWTYAAEDRTSFYSSFISGSQRLTNGNTLVCSGAQGRIFEVSPAGDVVWEFLNPFGGEVPRRSGRPDRGRPDRDRPDRDRPGGRRGGPPDGPQGGKQADAPGRGPRGGPGGRRGGPGGQDDKHGLFRATRIAPDHPGLALLRARDDG